MPAAADTTAAIAATGTASEDLRVPLRGLNSMGCGLSKCNGKDLIIGCAGYVVMDNIMRSILYVFLHTLPGTYECLYIPSTMVGVYLVSCTGYTERERGRVHRCPDKWRVKS